MHSTGSNLEEGRAAASPVTPAGIVRSCLGWIVGSMPQSSGFSLHTASPPSIDDTEAAHREGSHLEEGLAAAAVGPTPPVDASHGGGYYSSSIDYDPDRLLGPVRASTGVGSRGTGLVRANRGVQAPRGDSPQQLRMES